MGFADRFIELIMLCVTTVRYKVGINGDLIDFIVPTCGLRQGDPLSPYLFILCAEGLSHLLTGAVRRKVISPCVVARGAPGVSHLFFADDSLLFFKATVNEAEAVKDCLVSYERMSGQCVNFGKSCIIFSRNTDDMIKNNVATVFNVQQVHNIGRYLGLPMGVGRNKREVFEYIEAKLKQRLGGWNKKVLSRAGKEVLLKSVAQAIPTYTMSIYYLPVTFCERLERMMNKFWWLSSRNGGGGIRWMAWDRMCGPKSMGGLGFKNLHKFNVALLAKQGWRLLSNPCSMVAKIYKARYYATKDFLDANIGTNPSYCWRSIVAGQEILRKGCFVRIGNGQSTCVWNKPWLPDIENPFIQTPAPDHSDTIKVSSLLIPNTAAWDIERLNQLFMPRDVELIKKIPVSPAYDDRWCWRGDIRGCYSVKHGYRMLVNLPELEGGANLGWKKIWNLQIPPNIRNFIWRCFHNMIPTMVSLSHRGVAVDVHCPLCHQVPETLHHLFCECEHTVHLWNTHDGFILPGHNEGFVVWLAGVVQNSETMVLLDILAKLWSIWRGRNSLVWSAKPWNIERVRLEVMQHATYWQGLLSSSVGAIDNNLPMVSSAIMDTEVVRIEVDADNNEAYYGIVISDGDGVFMAAKNGKLCCLNDPHLAEAMAVKEALSWAKARGHNKIMVLSDCQMVCNLINRSMLDLSYAGCVIADCRNDQRHFEVVSFKYFPQSVNKAAHALARATRSQTGPSVWLFSIPSCIEHLL
ncbi:PREDICTED: uncharacterized protein LOC109176397 [Ipomoea nil]|uniref:uncharacterized protein LOC109176397 n=1 Tax=Ipomoea nil TaxID=35883 RepID=UPI0009009EDF|nr:PREDICTED: uncharacterized protein LOC109176397 [Ipomoea nil]